MDSIGHCIMELIKTGTEAMALAKGWKAIMKPQSPVIPATPLFSNHFTASMNSCSTSSLSAPACAMANVKPGTTRKSTS
eukprot:Skav212248  [mRNA]  locus=scaffold999:56955:62017:+ [translate_table: standard]